MARAIVQRWRARHRRPIWQSRSGEEHIPANPRAGRDSAAAIRYGDDVAENDPKLSPDGSRVAFIRRAPNSGANGFGWRIFVVPAASPLNEVNVSVALGSSLLNDDVLPEWVDDTTLVFANIASSVGFNTRTSWVMQRGGSGRKRVALPEGFRYSDDYPFRDNAGNPKMAVSA
ncbi:MAG: hypothetical protein AMS22_05270, partial [Thiotrichales bacterium SG8_50]